MAAPGTMGPRVQRGIQPLKCSVCGSVWFRSVTFLPSYPQARLQAPLAVCLCGTAVTLPPLSGIRPPAEQAEIDRLFAVLEVLRSLRQAIEDAEVLSAIPAGATLPSQVARLERSCQFLRRRLLATEAAVTRSRHIQEFSQNDLRDNAGYEAMEPGIQTRPLSF